MKMLNVKSTGAILFIYDGKEGILDTSHADLSPADQSNLQGLIDTLQANNLQEIHMEENTMRSFVHKVGIGQLIEEDDPNAYESFATLHQWGPQVYEE